MSRDLIPALVFSPQEIVREEWEASELSKDDLEKLSQGSSIVVDEIINGKRAITSDIAYTLSEIFGASPQFWINIENNYRKFLRYSQK